MNYRAHALVPPSIRIELSMPDDPWSRRLIEVPRSAPTRWLTEAYRLSIGMEQDAAVDEYSSRDDAMLAALDHWRPDEQQLAMPGLSTPLTLVVRGLQFPDVGDACVAIIDTGVVAPPDDRASTHWQTDRPPFRLDHVNLELARRFGVVVPSFDPSGIAALDRGIRQSSPIAALVGSLSSVRRLALRAHLDQCGVLDSGTLDGDVVHSATEALRTLIQRVGVNGVEQNADDGWLPRSLLDDVTAALGWPHVAPDALPRPIEALVEFARRSRLIRRLQGRVVVTGLGHLVRTRHRRGASGLVDALRDVDRDGLSWPRQTVATTLALLAIADGTAATFADVPAIVAAGQAATAASQDSLEEEGDSAYRPHYDGFERPDSATSTRPVMDALAALSAPHAYGAITPAMRSMAGAALR